ncbi:MAG: hypothetical protein IKN78_01795 [Bacteroidales bacterium]|jgi:hypothetical protein|nr:hypothetical protein [Bacteroidales bacterium]
MKKVFLFFGSALICAAMAACGGNAEATDSNNADSMQAETEQTEEAAPAPESTEGTVDMNARQQAIMDAAQQICNCGDVLNCVNTVIDQSFAQYANDAEFKAAVKAEAEKCIANKVKDKAVEKGKEVAKDAAKKGVEEGLKALKK